MPATSAYMDAFYKRTHSCAEKLDLTVFDRVVRINDGPKGSFELRSADDSRRFIAPSNDDRRKWIRMIMSTLSALRLRVMDVQRLRTAPKEYASDVTTLDMQFIAHYLIDLQCEHALSGNPRALLNNQNFVIAAAIWSFASDASVAAYVHSERYTSTVYQVAAHGTERAVKGATSVAAATTGALAGAVVGAVAGPGMLYKGLVSVSVLCNPMRCWSTAEELAVAGCGVVFGVPFGAVTGAVVCGQRSFCAVDEHWK